MKEVANVEIVASAASFFVPLSCLGGIVEMKTKNFLISEIVALAMIGFGYFMASSDFFRVLMGDYVPKCPPGFACTQSLRNYSEIYGHLLVTAGTLIFFILLIVFIISKIIKHVKS